MSGIFKKIGKVFSKVIKVVKKVALPALAIGAIALTGGAALGLVGAGGVTGLGSAAAAGIGSLGLPAGVTAALTTAAQGAVMGAATSAITGGNVLKGAATGFAVGGAAGALGVGAQAPNAANAGGTPAIGQAAPGSLESAFDAALMPNGGGIGSGIIPGVRTLAPTATVSGGGLGGWLERNPLLAGNLIQGIGGGLMAAQQAKEERRQDEMDRASYDGFVGTNTATVGDGSITIPRLERDPETGRIVQKRS